MFEGRWDLTIFDGERTFPSWVELNADGSGWFVGEVGSARPIPSIHVYHDHVRWRLHKQYEARDTEMEFQAHLSGETLVGKSTNGKGQDIRFEGHRAPDLAAPATYSFGDPIELVGPDKSGWRVRSESMADNWRITDEGLENTAVGTDLVTTSEFASFRLAAEYRYPAGSNSGIYLRGRYEYQILDDYGADPHVGGSAAIYGFLVPTANIIRQPDEWNRAEITLLGRFITVVLNGTTVIDHREIPGITGGRAG